MAKISSEKLDNLLSGQMVLNTSLNRSLKNLTDNFYNLSKNNEFKEWKKEIESIRGDIKSLTIKVIKLNEKFIEKLRVVHG
mgnify:CR=1 FL=1